MVVGVVGFVVVGVVVVGVVGVVAAGVEDLTSAKVTNRVFLSPDSATVGVAALLRSHTSRNWSVRCIAVRIPVTTALEREFFAKDFRLPEVPAKLVKSTTYRFGPVRLITE